jgi:hypothetical protein
MPSLEDMLNDAGKLAVEKIRGEHDSKNLNDTRNSRNNISYKVKNKKLEIEGLLRTIILDTGRKPGTMPPIEPIEKWVISKLGVEEDKAKGVAFAIAKKIKAKGTRILRDKTKGLQIQLLIEEINNDLFEKIANGSALTISNMVNDAYK